MDSILMSPLLVMWFLVAMLLLGGAASIPATSRVRHLKPKFSERSWKQHPTKSLSLLFVAIAVGLFSYGVYQNKENIRQAKTALQVAYVAAKTVAVSTDNGVIPPAPQLVEDLSYVEPSLSYAASDATRPNVISISALEDAEFYAKTLTKDGKNLVTLTIDEEGSLKMAVADAS